MALGAGRLDRDQPRRERNVVVDLPAEKASPGKQIKFSDARSRPVRPRRPAGRDVRRRRRLPRIARRRSGRRAALDRTARSDALVLATAAGLGAIEQADFRGNVTFTDGTRLQAEAPRAIYQVAQDRLDLSPGDG